MNRKLPALLAAVLVAIPLTARAGGINNTCYVTPRPAIEGQVARAHGANYAANRPIVVNIDFPNGNSDGLIISTDAAGKFNEVVPDIGAGNSGTGTGTITVSANGPGHGVICGPNDFTITWGLKTGMGGFIKAS